MKTGEQLALNFDGPPLSAEQARVHRLIRPGRRNARSEKFLARETGMNGVKVRQIIKHLTEEHGILIVSATSMPYGFFFPESREEYRAGVAQYVNRIRSLARRLKAMDREYYEQILGGARLEI